MNDFIQSPHNGQKNKRVPTTRRVLDSNRPYNSTPKFHSNKYQGSRNGNMQRSARQNSQNYSSDQATMLSTATAEAIVSIAKTMAANQELLMEIQERRIATEERKAGALENIAEFLLSLSIPFEQKDDETYSDEPYQGDEIICDDETCQNKDETVANEKPMDKKTGFTKEINTQSAETTPPKNTRRTGIVKPEETPCKTPTPVKGTLSREDAMKMIEQMRGQGSTFSEIAQYLIATGQPTFSGKGKWHAQTIHRLLQKHKQMGMA